MITSIRSTQSTIFHKIICSFITIAFMSTVAIPPSTVSAQASPAMALPTPGVMVPLSPAYTPALIMGLEVHPDNPLQFDFIIHRGQSKLKGEALKDESSKLIKYFLASLTVPDDETWVNLSPYEKDQIIPESFGVTEMGRDLLAQDYLLKQLTASLIYPEDQLGQTFWKRVRERAYEEYGTVELPVNTFNKVWIVPDRAEVFEQNNVAYIADSHLKVLLEDDYLALENNSNSAKFRTDEVANEDVKKMSEMTAPIVREIILPEIEKEINAGQTFAQLRQVYNSMILATWYKQSLKESLLGKVYINQNKVAGIDLAGKDAKLKIYDRYMDAFKKGVYNYIRKDYDQYAQKPVPRKYFSGGISKLGPKGFGIAGTGSVETKKRFAGEDNAMLVVKADIVEATPQVIEAVEEMEVALAVPPTDFAMPSIAVSADRAMLAMDEPNLAKRMGVIPHRTDRVDGAFSVNYAIKQAFEKERVIDASSDMLGFRNSFVELLVSRKDDLSRILADYDMTTEEVKNLILDDSVSIYFVGDTKNGSPAIVMRTEKDFQYAHVGGIKNHGVSKSIYFGQGMADAMLSGNRQVFIKLGLREFVGLAVASSRFDGNNYDEAIRIAEEIAEKVEKELFGDEIDLFVREQMDQFIQGYYQELKERAIIWDTEYSVLPEELGKDLVGGKTYQQGRYWAEDDPYYWADEEPGENFRSMGVSTRAAEKLLLAHPEKLKQINGIIDALDATDEPARQQAYQEIRKIVLSIELPKEMETQIGEEYKKMVEVGGNELVAVRSAGKAEDISLSIPELEGIDLGSNAGQHDSFLAEFGEKIVAQRWLDCVASLYTDRVLSYRDTMMVYVALGDILPNKEMTKKIVEKLEDSNDPDDKIVAKSIREKDPKIVSSLRFRDVILRHGFNEAAKWVEQARRRFMALENISMGVTVMPMGDAIISVVAFGHDLTTNWTGITFQEKTKEELLNEGRVVTITANYGIGESIVQDRVNPDSFLVHIFKDDEGTEHINILNHILGTKTVMATYTKPVMDMLGLDLDDLAEWLAFMNGKDHGALKGLDPKADPESVKEVLRDLTKANEDRTASIRLPKDKLKLFEYSREEINKLAHLLKATLEDPNIRTMFTDVPFEMRMRYSITDSQVRKYAREFMRKAHNYGHLVDMEGVIGNNFNRGHDNVPATVQRRPSNVDGDVKNPDLIKESYTYVLQKDAKEVRDKKQRIIGIDDVDTGIDVGEILALGLPTRNSFSGQIFMVDIEEDLVPQFKEIKRLADEGHKIIIRTPETRPDFVPILKHPNVVGVAADGGGATSHAAVISRELGIATVVGIQSYIDGLVESVGSEKAKQVETYLNTPWNWVTVDANMSATKSGKGAVYAGKLPISKRKIKIPIPDLPYIYTPIRYIMGMPHPMLSMSKMAGYDGFGGVALQRLEFAYAELAINPRGGVAYDNMVVYDYLKSLGDSPYAKNFYEQLSPQRQKALEHFKLHFYSREEQREKGIATPETRSEYLVKKFKDFKTVAKGSATMFWESLDKYKQADVQAVRNDGKALAACTKRIEGNISFSETYERVVGAAVATMSAAMSVTKNRNVVRSCDFKKNEAQELIFSETFDPVPESSTMYGERGAGWILQPENQVILKKETRLLLQQALAGYTNIGFMLPFVRTPEEMDRLLTIIETEERKLSKQLSEELGKPTPVYLREIVQMVELPSNIALYEEFFRVMDRHETRQKEWFKKSYGVDIVRDSSFSFGTNDLTQTKLGADRDHEGWAGWFFKESHRFVIEAIRHVVNLSKKYGKKCGLCGQALVNLVESDPEAAEEIIMMLGSTHGYAGTDYLGTLAAIKRSASATLEFGVIEEEPGEEALLLDDFLTKVKKGAAFRTYRKVSEIKDVDTIVAGDFVLFDQNLPVEDVDFEDEELMDKIAMSGAILYSSHDLDKALVKISRKGIPIIKITQVEETGLGVSVFPGDKITIDFNNGKLYSGVQDVKIRVPFVESKFQIPEDVKEPQRAEFGGRIRSSDIYRALGEHPLVLMKTEEGQARLKKAIEARIKEAADETTQPIVYETLDMEVDDQMKLRGAEEFYKKAEINPALGYFGLEAWMRDDRYTGLMRFEMEVISSLLRQGYDIAIQFNSVRVPVSSLRKAMVLLKEVGIKTDNVQVGINTAWPGNYAFLDEYIAEGLNFVTIDEGRLAQAFLAADLYKNWNVRRFYHEKKVLPVLDVPIRMIKAAASKNNIVIDVIPFNESLGLSEEELEEIDTRAAEVEAHWQANYGATDEALADHAMLVSIREQDYLDKTLRHVAVERAAFVFFVNDGQSPTLAKIAQELNLEAKQLFALNENFEPNEFLVVNATVRLPINDKTSELVGVPQVAEPKQDRAMMNASAEQLLIMIQREEFGTPLTLQKIWAHEVYMRRHVPVTRAKDMHKYEVRARLMELKNKGFVIWDNVNFEEDEPSYIELTEEGKAYSDYEYYTWDDFTNAVYDEKVRLRKWSEELVKYIKNGEIEGAITKPNILDSASWKKHMMMWMIVKPDAKSKLVDNIIEYLFNEELILPVLGTNPQEYEFTEKGQDHAMLTAEERRVLLITLDGGGPLQPNLSVAFLVGQGLTELNEKKINEVLGWLRAKGYVGKAVCILRKKQ